MAERGKPRRLLPPPVGFTERRDYSIRRLILAFPGDREGIEAMAALNPGKLPRLEPAGAGETIVLISARPNQHLRWTVVWE